MYLKINYYRGSTLGRMLRISLTGMVFLCLVWFDICRGAVIDELRKESTFYQKLSSGESIKYYTNIERGTNLEPLSYDLTVLYKPWKKLIGKYSWALTSNTSKSIPDNGASFLEIPLEVPEQYLKKSLKDSRYLYLDYTEEYVDVRNRKHNNVKHSIVMLKIFIENKKMNRRWVIYAPYLYIASQIDLPEKWAPKNIWYLIGRELGLSPNNVGRFSHEPNGSFFKIRLHERIDNYYGMKITIDGSRSLPVEALGSREDQRIFQMRVGARDDLNYSGTILMDATLSNHKNDLVGTSYLSNDYSEINIEDKSNVYLEELTFNFPLLEPPSNLVSFVKQISFYKSSRSRLIANLKNNLFVPIVLNPRFIRGMGEGIGRLEVGLSDFPGELKKRILVDGTKIIKAGLIVDTRGSLVRMISVFKKGSLKFRNTPELVIFKNKKYLNQQDLLDKIPAPINHVEILNANIIKTTTPPSNLISLYMFRGNSLVLNISMFIFCFAAIIFCFIGFESCKRRIADACRLVTTIFGRLQIRSNYFACLGLFMCFLGFLISLFAGVEPFSQVYDINFIFKDILFALGGLVLAVNWKYQCVKIYLGLKNSRLNSLGNFFKNYNSSYLTGIIAVLCLCAVSRQFYLPLVETFSSLSISLILVGTYHYIYQRPEYKFDALTNHT